MKKLSFGNFLSSSDHPEIFRGEIYVREHTVWIVGTSHYLLLLRIVDAPSWCRRVALNYIKTRFVMMVQRADDERSPGSAQAASLIVATVTVCHEIRVIVTNSTRSKRLLYF